MSQSKLEKSAGFFEKIRDYLLKLQGYIFLGKPIDSHVSSRNHLVYSEPMHLRKYEDRNIKFKHVHYLN